MLHAFLNITYQKKFQKTLKTYRVGGGGGVLAWATSFDLGLSGSSWILRTEAAGMMVTKGYWKG